MIELLEELKNRNDKLFQCLQNIRNFSVEVVWKDRLLPWFTNHNTEHSEEIIFILGHILEPLKSTSDFLNEHELFMLLASAYLHDIGMQYLKVESISVEQLTEKDYEEVRRRHAEESYNIILKTVEDSVVRDDFHFPTIDEQYIPVIALVSKGHSSDYFDQIVREFKDDPRTPKGRPCRGELLTALLLIADELDLQCKRVEFSELAKYTLSAYSRVHWFKHHYIDTVDIKDGNIAITLRYPSNPEGYEHLIREFIESKLVQQIKRVNHVLRGSTSGLLHLNETITVELKQETTGVKRAMPPEVLQELKKLMNKNRLSPSILLGFSPTIPKPTDIFIGRAKKKEELENALRLANFVSIEGIGGIGKTEFALKYIEESLPAKQVVWFECVLESDLDALIEASGFPDLLKGKRGTELAKYSGFTDLIDRGEKIIFLDNFHDVVDSSFDKFLKFAEKRLRRVKIVLIAREHPDISVKLIPVELKGFNIEESLEYARKFKDIYYKDLILTDSNLSAICKAVEGHPLAIELAIRLVSYGGSPEDVLQKLADPKSKNQELSRRLLDEVFSHPKSTDKERSIMLYLSIFRNEVAKDVIAYIAGTDELDDTLHRLIDKKMISFANALYKMHPLIREFCYQRIQDRDILHGKAAAYLETKRSVKFDPSLEEEIYYHLLNAKHTNDIVDLILSKGGDFVYSGHVNSLSEMINYVKTLGFHHPQFDLLLGDVANLRGEWEAARTYFESAFSSQGADEKVLADSYRKYGELLYDKYSIKEAMSYFEDAYKTASKHGHERIKAYSLDDMAMGHKKLGNVSLAKSELEEALRIFQKISDMEGIALSLNNIGRILHDKGDLNGAMEKYKESLKTVEEIGHKIGVADCLNNIGNILRTKGDLNSAMEKYKESLKIAEEIGDRGGISMFLNSIGNILRIKGDLSSAMEKHKESLKIREEIGDRRGIATSLNNIGDVLHAKGDFNGALEKYKESLKILDDIGYREGIAASLNSIGGILCAKGDLYEALKKHEESLAIDEEIGDIEGIAASLNNIGSILHKIGDLNGALKNYEKSLTIQDEIGNREGIAASLNNIGGILCAKGDLYEALKKHEESLAIQKETGDRRGIATSLNNIGNVLHKKGDLKSAMEKYKESLKIAKEIGDRGGISTFLTNIGDLLHKKGDLNGALKNYEESLEIELEIGAKEGMANSYHNIGTLWFDKGNYVKSLHNLFLSLALQRQIGIHKEVTSSYIAGIRQKRGLQEFKKLTNLVLKKLDANTINFLDLEPFLQDETVRHEGQIIGRNDPCPCGSGKKYKKCCGR